MRAEVAFRSLCRSLRAARFGALSATISYAVFFPRTSFSRSVISSGCRRWIRVVTASIAHVAAAPAAAPMRTSIASGRLFRGTLDTLLDRADELRGVERFDNDLTDFVELPVGDISRICGGHDDSCEELGPRFGQLPQDRKP